MINNDLMSYAFRKNDYNTGTQLNLHNFTSPFGLIYFDLIFKKRLSLLYEVLCKGLP